MRDILSSSVVNDQSGSKERNHWIGYPAGGKYGCIHRVGEILGINLGVPCYYLNLAE
jgi:hypothetical protein